MAGRRGREGAWRAASGRGGAPSVSEGRRAAEAPSN